MFTFILLKMIESSFISAIFKSRCVFSITFAASATFMLSALYTPASTIIEYTCDISSSDSSSIPDTIFNTFVTVCTLSPGFIRSGEYPTLKSAPQTRPDSFSNTGTHISSVTPGYTVDSKTTISPFFKCLPTSLLALIRKDRFGVLSSAIGVGTATI